MPDHEKWKKVAEGRHINVTSAQIEKIAPALDALAESARRALDHDLSLVEPVAVFRPEKS